MVDSALSAVDLLTKNPAIMIHKMDSYICTTASFSHPVDDADVDVLKALIALSPCCYFCVRLLAIQNGTEGEGTDFIVARYGEVNDSPHKQWWFNAELFRRLHGQDA